MPTQTQLPLVAAPISRSNANSPSVLITGTARSCNRNGTRRAVPSIRCCNGTTLAAGETARGGAAVTTRIRQKEGTTTLKATVTAVPKLLLTTLVQKAPARSLPKIKDFVGDVADALDDALDDKVEDELKREGFHLEVFSAEELIGPVSAFAVLVHNRENKYVVTFPVPASFGSIGAIRVKNEHYTEHLIKDISVRNEGSGVTTDFDCNSWVPAAFGRSDLKRVFFPLKSYLPSETPKGVEKLRKSELEATRGDGHGERKRFERVYDYDVYNDLGDPDKRPETKRPVLGGEKHPYPRRCRTGRPRCTSDTSLEEPSSMLLPYLPRDEQFSEEKYGSFIGTALLSLVRQEMLGHADVSFASFAAIDAMFNYDVHKLPAEHGLDTLFDIFAKQKESILHFLDELEKHLSELALGELAADLRHIVDNVKELFSRSIFFEEPELISRDKFAWLKDEEFARETLAGLNPLSIQLVTEQHFPFVSKFDEKTYDYGSPVSLITADIIKEQIHGVMTAEEVVKSNRLFMLDYHDMFLPYVSKVRELKGTTLYGSRTVFFLQDDGMLKPIAIELTRPKSPALPQWRHVFTPRSDPEGSWLWMLAKAHVVAHDSGYHQLISHWLRTHCSVEPYIIAANRQLSKMHPIYRLLHPHFRYNMEINALARQMLINAEGTIERTFFPGKYSMELSSVVYDQTWRFDMEALPEDLIRRGMAFRGPDGKLNLTIEDYPFANDGLLVWDAIKEWASDYVAHYYKTEADVTDDGELQGWWTEVRTKGHADKKEGWPELDSRESLIHVLTTIMWVASGLHAAVNFGQYPYAAYFPNRPTIARKNMPMEAGDLEEMEGFRANPEKALLDTFPSQVQAATVMMVMDDLSTHSPDEEYMGSGKSIPPAWLAEEKVRAAHDNFCTRMKEIAAKVDARNRKLELKNRCGPGVMPYELLKPSSGPGVTGKGIPNSISI